MALLATYGHPYEAELDSYSSLSFTRKKGKKKKKPKAALADTAQALATARHLKHLCCIWKTLCLSWLHFSCASPSHLASRRGHSKWPGWGRASDIHNEEGKHDVLLSATKNNLLSNCLITSKMYIKRSRSCSTPNTISLLKITQTLRRSATGSGTQAGDLHCLPLFL